MKKTLLVAVALAMLACTTAAWCQGPPPPGGGPGGPGGPGGASLAMAIMPPPAGAIDNIATTLSLTTEKAAELKAVLTEGETALATLQKTAADANKAFRTAVTAATYVETDVAQARSAAEAAEIAIVDQCLITWTAIRGVLTADQLTKLQAGPGAPPSCGSGTSSVKRR